MVFFQINEDNHRDTQKEDGGSQAVDTASYKNKERVIKHLTHHVSRKCGLDCWKYLHA